MFTRLKIPFATSNYYNFRISENFSIKIEKYLYKPRIIVCIFHNLLCYFENCKNYPEYDLAAGKSRSHKHMGHLRDK